MARPIKPTPVLNEKESEEFLRAVEENSHKASYPKCGPSCLDKARETARKYALAQEKLHCR